MADSWLEVPVFFYNDYMIFNREKVVYEDIIIVANMYSFAKEDYLNDKFFFATKNKLYDNVVGDFGRFFKEFIDILLEEKTMDEKYYCNILKELDNSNILKMHSNVMLKYECVMRTLENNPDDYELQRRKTYYDLNYALTEKNKAISNHKEKVSPKKNYMAMVNLIDKYYKILAKGVDYNIYKGCYDTYLDLSIIFSMANRYGYIVDSKYKRLFATVCNKLYKMYKNDEIIVQEYEDRVYYEESEKIDFLVSCSRDFYGNKQLQNYELSAKMLDEVMKQKGIQLHEDYGELTYIMSIYYRDGLGGKEKSQEKRYDYLIQSANRGFALSEYELFKMFRAEGNEEEAEQWREQAYKHGIKDEKMYRKSWDEKFVDVTGMGIVESFGTVSNVMGSVASAVNSTKTVASDSKSIVGELFSAVGEFAKIQAENINAQREVEVAKVNKDLVEVAKETAKETTKAKVETENLKAQRKKKNWENRVDK